MRKLIIGLVAGAVLATTAVAVASIPSSDGVFTACVKSDGTLRLIDAEAGATCKASERTVTWNQTGPQGPVGPQGPAGPTGPQGPAGVASIRYVTATNTVEEDGSFGDKHADCGLNETVLGGGYQVGPTTHVMFSGPANFRGDEIGDSWAISGYGTPGDPIAIYAVCAVVDNPPN